MKQILLRGPPGSGKSTFSRLFLKEFPRSTRLSSGDILRNHFRSQPPGLGAGILRGELAESDLVMKLMVQEYRRVKDPVVLLDGFPRKIEELKRWIDTAGPPAFVVYCECKDDLILKKLTSRRICERCGSVYNLYSDNALRPILPRVDGECDDCTGGRLIQRQDDSEETVRNRLQIYRDHESGILAYIATILPAENIFRVDTEGGTKMIADSIRQIAGKL